MVQRIFYILLLLFPFYISAQTVSLSQRVSMDYDNESLEAVLTDIGDNYSISFAYSPDIIPVDQKVNLHVDNEPMAVALDNLFVETYIVYARIGDQIVLKIDENKFDGVGEGGQDMRLSDKGSEVQFDSGEKIYKAEEMKTDSPIQTAKLERKVMLEDALSKTLPKALTSEGLPQFEIDYSELSFGGALIPNLKNLKLNFEFLEDLDEVLEDLELDSMSAQISLFPRLKTKVGKKKDTSNLSINVLVGKSKNVDGLDLGIINIVEQELEGLQVAGIGSTVGGRTVGSQFSGIFNVTNSESIGTQVAGIVNVAEDFIGIQVAGIANVTRNKFSGIQVATISNVANQSKEGIQVAVIRNQSNQKIDSQFSVFSNRAHTVTGQLGLVNRAKKVKGAQLGLINFADSSNVSIGLLNFVRRGYNHLEIGGGETMHLNANLKLGTKGFYNIFYAGKRLNENTWAAGYGIGSYINLGKKTGLNLELLASLLSENIDGESEELGAWGKFRTTLDFRLGKRMSLFLGPDINAIFSDAYDKDTQTYGSKLAPYTLYEKNITLSENPQPVSSDNIVNVKAWVGINAGVRF